MVMFLFTIISIAMLLYFEPFISTEKATEFSQLEQWIKKEAKGKEAAKTFTIMMDADGVEKEYILTIEPSENK